MQLLKKIFRYDENNFSLKSEIIGGLITFISICYVLPVNASVMSTIGMNEAGVFAVTAILSAFICILMGLIANYPLVLTAGMGLNAYVAYSMSNVLYTTWQQKMIFLTIAGLVFFVLSLTPVRQKIVDIIPDNVKKLISVAVGSFIIFVGFSNSGLVVYDASTIVKLGNFLDPAVFIAFLTTFLCIGLTFSKNKILKIFAIPIAVLVATILGVIVSSILIANNNLVFENEISQWIYKDCYLEFNEVFLPIAPWFDKTSKFGIDLLSIKKVFMLGVFDGYSSDLFVNDLLNVLKTPLTYFSMFSVLFVNLFNTTASTYTVGKAIGKVDEKGKISGFKRVAFVDSLGAMLSGPFGTSLVTSYQESYVSVSVGAKTGLSSIVSGLLFGASLLIYPVFSMFTAGSAIACALISVGLIIIFNTIKEVDFKDPVIVFSFILTILVSSITYSITSGLGFGIIAYIIGMLISKKKEEVNLTIIIVGVLFLISFLLESLTPLIK